MERAVLNAQKREAMTKGELNKLRLLGNVPAVLYGRKMSTQTLVVNTKELEKVAATKAGLNVLIDLAIAGEAPATVLIRDYQAHPIGRNFTHVDFQVIDVTERIVVEVPINLIGQPIGVKEGGVLEQLLRKIEIKCPATQIPEQIEINVENLKIGDSIHSSQLQLPQGAEFNRTMNYTVVTVVPPIKEEAPPVEAAAPVEGAPLAEGAVPAEGAAAAPAAGKTAPAAKAEDKAKGAEKKKPEQSQK